MNNFKSGDEGLVTYKSSNPFEFFHILNSKESEEQDMFGTLIFPEEKKEKCPLVICMHGSLGWRGHHHEHAVNFLNNLNPQTEFLIVLICSHVAFFKNRFHQKINSRYHHLLESYLQYPIHL